LQQSAIRRFNQRLRRLRWLRSRRQVGFTEIGKSLEAWLAHADTANSMGLRRELWRRVRF
jgi:hypothetical protein